ncbi:dienelactone hydrolase family protein [Massilia horti]|uniref:Alpha/beta hydrolase n=1 Tax=Massilia horti TaxID=2562153 RepID=A0A4Y9T6C8_9BURK|nr:dienelactone hydrolase family protein [Massilia horti]TFW33725.1 alpha/beta hydrolase [Massilia horti]
MESKELVQIGAGTATMEGMLELPTPPIGVVLFAHGSGSSRLSPRNNYVAGVLREARIGTLLLDLLTPQEDRTYENRFNIPLLTQRLGFAAAWLSQQPATSTLKLGLFGASTGAAAALQLAAEPGIDIAAVVSRGGRPDLAGRHALQAVRAPTLLLVGGDDDIVIELNRRAHDDLRCEKQLVIVPGATHLFEEPGKLEEVASLATNWFVSHFPNG